MATLMRFCLICGALLLALSGCRSVVHRPSPPSVENSVTAAAAKVSLRTKQFAAALHELQFGAQHGDVQSEYLLGLVYANGLGTDVSVADARRWLSAAAEKSNADAAYALAGLLAQGSREDRESARRWLERAAAAGQPLAGKLVANHSLPLAAARGASGDAKLARELVIWAIRHDTESLGTFIKAAGIESTDEFGRSPLAYAITIGSAAAVRQLLSAGASVDHADRFGVTPLMLAAETASDRAGSEATPSEGDSILEALLKSARGINARDSVGNTALFYAARAGRVRHVARLLAAGASCNGPNADGWTVLDVSAEAGHAEVAKLLREAGATGSLKVSRVREASGVDPTQPGELYASWPPLAIAASRDDVEVVERLLADGARADEPTPRGDTPLLVAAKYRAAKVIAPLLKAGASPQLADNEGNTVVGYAAGHGAMAVLDALLEKGVSPDNHGSSEAPPLVSAARVGDLTAMKHLMDAGANVNSTDPTGTTALMVAAAAPNVEMAQLLLPANPRLSLSDRTGRNALWFASSSGGDQIVDLLLAAGSPIGGPAGEASPLFAAVQAGRANTLERLLRKGLPPDARSATEDTPLIAAAARGDAQIVRVLLDGGAGIDAQNAVGNTALIEAVRAGQIEVCRILLAAGADAGLHNRERIDALDTARRRHLSEIVAMLEHR
jgi:uncharacterized protein